MKTYLFRIPEEWDIKKCKIEYKDGKLFVERQINCYISERCISDILDGDDYEIKELDSWETKACIAAGR